MKKDIVNFEYGTVYSDFSPKTNKNGYIGNVSVSVFEVDSNSNIISAVGVFNFKVKTKNDAIIEKFIKEKLKQMVVFKLKKQEKIDKDFEKIIKTF